MLSGATAAAGEILLRLSEDEQEDNFLGEFPNACWPFISRNDS